MTWHRKNWNHKKSESNTQAQNPETGGKCWRCNDPLNTTVNSYLNISHTSHWCISTLNNVPCLNLLLLRTIINFKIAEIFTQNSNTNLKRLNWQTAVLRWNLQAFHRLLTEQRCLNCRLSNIQITRLFVVKETDVILLALLLWKSNCMASFNQNHGHCAWRLEAIFKIILIQNWQERQN